MNCTVFMVIKLALTLLWKKIDRIGFQRIATFNRLHKGIPPNLTQPDNLLLG